MPKLIKIHDNVYDELTLLKKEKETYSEVIVRLITLYILFQKVQGKWNGYLTDPYRKELGEPPLHIGVKTPTAEARW